MSNDHETLDEKIHQMAKELDAWPSVAPRVMREVRRREAQHNRVTVPNRKLRWVTRRVTRYAAMLSGVIVLVWMFTIWQKPVGMVTGIAFADVQQAIRQIETAVVVSEHPERPFWNHRILYRRDSDLVRKEWQNGLIYINDGHGKQLVLNPNKRTAQLCVGKFFDSPPRDYLDDLANAQHDSFKQLGERTFNGKTLVGFALSPKGSMANEGLLRGEIWIDPQTLLPVHEELIPTDPDDFVSAIWRSTTFFTFNMRVDESLFRITPPEDYTMLEGHHWHQSMMPPVAELPEDPNITSPEIDPQRGIGPAYFGMSAKEVVQALGRPDEMSYFQESSPESLQRQNKMFDELYKKISKEVKEKNLGEFEEHRLRQEMYKKLNIEYKKFDSKFPPMSVTGVNIEYKSRGFSLEVDQELGLRAIFCSAGKSTPRDFTGKTIEGIEMGSTLEEIEKAYGLADRKNEDPGRKQVSLDYRSLGMYFFLEEGRLCKLSINLADKAED